MNNEKKHVIFSSMDNEGDDSWWYDEHDNLNKELDGTILAIAELHLWDGVKWGYQLLGNNLNDVLRWFGCDDIEVFFNGKDICSNVHHHDGTNVLTFRKIKKGKDVTPLLKKIYAGNFTQSDVTKHTTSLGKFVKEIYGW